MAYLKHCVDAVKMLGGTNVAGPLYSSVGRVWQMTDEERAKDTDLLVKQLRELAEYAGDKGAVLGVEPLNRFETSFINLASQAIEVVDRVDHPACRVMLDTFHMISRNNRSALRSVLPGSGWFTFIAAKMTGAHRVRDMYPGMTLSAALKDIGYDGPVVIESFTSAVKSIARAAAIWRPLASSQMHSPARGWPF